MATETCPKCEAVYEVGSAKVPFRDKDSFECRCGETLASWNGSRFPTYRLITPGKTKDA